MAPAWSAMIVGIEFRFLRQFGTGLDGFNDKREAFFVPSHGGLCLIDDNSINMRPMSLVLTCYWKSTVRRPLCVE